MEKNLFKKIILINPEEMSVLNRTPDKKKNVAKFLLDLPVIGTFLYNTTVHELKINRMFREKYYYKNENAIKCGMNSLEKTFKVLLRPIELKVKEKKNVSTNIKVGECVLIIDGPYKNINGTIKSIDNEYGEFDILINLFGEEFTVKVKFEDVEVK